MKRIRYAAYGSNLHPARLEKRVSSAIWVGCAALNNFKLRFHKRGADGSGKCNIVSAPGQIFVAVYDLTCKDKTVLDAVEGLGNGYEELQLEVPGYGSCYTYSAAASHIDERLKPYSWYKSLVLLGCQYNNFPGHYVQIVNAISEIRDANPKRHDLNMQLVETIVNGT